MLVMGMPIVDVIHMVLMDDRAVTAGGTVGVGVRLGGAVIGGVVLKGALESQQSTEPEGYKKMEWL